MDAAGVQRSKDASARRVALLFPMALGHYREITRGVQRFSAAMERWTISAFPPTVAGLSLALRWRPDGILASINGRPLVERLSCVAIPVVSVTAADEGLPWPVVDADHRAVGRMAAEHFVERGFTNYGFFGDPKQVPARMRLQGFRDVLEPLGFNVAECPAERGLGEPGLARPGLDRGLARWLQSLLVPAAVFAQDDASAKVVAETARSLGLRVPEEVAILGVDNDELECAMCAPPLSSILLPGEQIGFRASGLLGQRMRNQDGDAHAVALPPVGVVTRQSTDIVAVDDREISDALRFIRRHATDGIRVSDVLAAIPVARRTLEKRFHALLGRGPFEEIRRVQISEVKRLLVQGRYNVAEIAVRSGFESSQTLAVAFRKETGMTCSDFRRQCRPAIDGSAGSQHHWEPRRQLMPGKSPS